MKSTTTVLFTVAIACFLTACGASSADNGGTSARGTRTSDAPEVAAPVQPNNSAVNRRDVNSDNPTAGDQSETAADRDMTQRIRQAVIADDSLSMSAHNVKIVTIAGQVVLRGPVDSDAEKLSVEQKANGIAGSANVDSQLEVKR